MKIGYKQRHLNVNLILGLVWFVFFVIIVFTKDELSWTDYGWILISLMYSGLYLYQRQYKYLIIDKGIIKVNGPFGKKMNLSDIKRIKRFAGDYILKAEDKELTINTQIIEPDSLAELNAELKKLDVEWN